MNLGPVIRCLAGVSSDPRVLGRKAESLQAQEVWAERPAFIHTAVGFLATPHKYFSTLLTVVVLFTTEGLQ